MLAPRGLNDSRLVRITHSGLIVHFANAFHSYSRREYPDRKPYFEDLSIDSLAPDHVASPSFREYLAGRDPAMEVARTLLSKSPAPRPLANSRKFR
jgi:hypothetical protein